MLHHALGLLTHSHDQWQQLRYQTTTSNAEAAIGTLLLMAIIPPLALLIGITQHGWHNFDGTVFQISLASATPLAVLLYLLLLSSVVTIAYVMFKLEQYYGNQADFEQCLVFTVFTALPLFISGIIGLIPFAWPTTLVVLFAAGYSAYLLLSGMPIFLDITTEKRGFSGGIILVLALGLSVLSGSILWLFGRFF